MARLADGRFGSLLVAAALATSPFAVRGADVVQSSTGTCSPNIAHVVGSVTVQCSSDIPPAVVARIEARLQAELRGSANQHDAKSLELIRKTIKSEMLAFMMADPKRHMTGHVVTRIDRFPATTDIALESLVDRIATGVYAGPLYRDIDHAALEPEAKQAIIGFADRLGRACPPEIDIAAHLGRICPQRIRGACGQAGLEGQSSAYAQKLSMRYADGVKSLIQSEFSRINPGCATSINTAGYGLSRPEVAYPPAETATAPEWEAAAAQNMRVVIGVAF